MGKRGSLYGIGIAVCLVAVYLLVFFDDQRPRGNQSDAFISAAWAPNVLFAGWEFISCSGPEPENSSGLRRE